jgi:hypothetical protein
VKVLPELVLLRTFLVRHFQSGDFGTVYIFGDSSEEGFIKGADDY